MVLNGVVFISGAILMGLEIAGSRVLAPYFGNSIFVWGSLIGVFMAALSGGYYLGGEVADRHPRLSVLAGLVAAAGVSVFLVPFVGPGVSAFIARADLGPRGNPLAASMALFFIPSVLLGTVSPFAIKLRARDLERVGKAVGGLYALSTAGSIVGTLLTAFYLIPGMGVAALVKSLGLGLMLVAFIGMASERRMVAAGVAVALLVAMGAGFSGVPGAVRAADSGEGSRAADSGEGAFGKSLKTVYEADSLYHHIRVVEGGGSRYLRFDNSWQSGMYLDDPFRTRFEYTDFFDLSFAFNPEIKDVLFVGLGGGSAPKKFFRDHPEVRIDVAELDPAVVQVARKYFAVPDDPRLNIQVQDGRLFLEKTEKKYDLIVLDAYYADSIPFHLTTREFLKLAGSRLKPGGVVAANIIGAFDGPRSKLYRSMYRTFGEVWKTRYSFPVLWRPGRDARQTRNIILIATDSPRLAGDAIVSRAERVGERSRVPELAGYARDLYALPIPTDDVPVLTDDHAPVDSLLKFGE